MLNYCWAIIATDSRKAFFKCWFIFYSHFAGKPIGYCFTAFLFAYPIFWSAIELHGKNTGKTFIRSIGQKRENTLSELFLNTFSFLPLFSNDSVPKKLTHLTWGKTHQHKLSLPLLFKYHCLIKRKILSAMSSPLLFFFKLPFLKIKCQLWIHSTASAI